MKHSLKNRITKQLHRTLAAVFAACLLMISVEWPVLAANNGSCGTNLKWSLSVDGELAIAGKGAMTNYYEGAMAPWYSSREKITSIIKRNTPTIWKSWKELTRRRRRPRRNSLPE